MSINSRAKGKRGELELAKYLRERGYKGARRGQQFSGIEGQDVVGMPGFHVEVKRVEALNLGAALTQSIRDAAVDKTPLVVHRRNNQPWVVTLRLDDFLDILEIEYAAGDIGSTDGTPQRD